jgi:hypothetical protein
MYVIKRTDQGGGYVARPGSKHSYTRTLESARKFNTRTEADSDRCKGNEIVINVDHLLSGWIADQSW